MGKYFILVYSPAADSTFAITARPKKYVDEIPPEIMGKAKEEVYRRIKGFLASSDRRRHLSKVREDEGWEGRGGGERVLSFF